MQCLGAKGLRACLGLGPLCPGGGAGTRKWFPVGWWAAFLLMASSCTMGIQELAPEQQRDLYRKISAEIHASMAHGDASLQVGDYYQALTSYRRAAFFTTSPGLSDRIRELEKKISEESQALFIQGQNLSPRNHLEALFAFNQALRVNPDHQEARKARDLLLKKPDLQAEMTARQTALQRTWDNGLQRRENIAALAEQVEAFLAFRPEHPLAQEVKKYIDRERHEAARAYLLEGKELLADGKLKQASLSTRNALVNDPGNREIIALLAQIQQQLDLAHSLNLCRFRLQNRDYDKAEELAVQALAVAPESKEAATLLLRVRQERLDHHQQQFTQALAAREYQQAVVLLRRMRADGLQMAEWQTLQDRIAEILDRETPLMLAEGKRLYRENKLTEANRILTSLLDLDPGNVAAATYLRKTQNRLQTLQSLR